jgi:hypothetical protein
VQPIAAGAGVAVALGAVAGQVDEHLVAVGGFASPQALAFAGGDDVGEGHAAVDPEVLGQRGSGREVVHVPVVAVVVGQPRRHSGLRDQRVHGLRGGVVVDRIERRRDRAAERVHAVQVMLGQDPDLADVVTGDEVRQ